MFSSDSIFGKYLLLVRKPMSRFSFWRKRIIFSHFNDEYTDKSERSFSSFLIFDDDLLDITVFYDQQWSDLHLKSIQSFHLPIYLMLCCQFDEVILEKRVHWTFMNLHSLFFKFFHWIAVGCNISDEFHGLQCLIYLHSSIVFLFKYNDQLPIVIISRLIYFFSSQ